MTETAAALTKCCKACGKGKPLEEFHISRLNCFGRKTICKECVSRSVAARDYSSAPVPVFKVCGSCQQQKPAAEFNRNRRQRDGLSPHCRECQRVHHRKHYERHKARVLSKTAEWRERHPDKPYEYKSRHRARLAGCEGEFTAEEWAELKRRFRYRCVRCGAFEGSLWAPQLSPDHIVPLSRGGKNTIENIQPLCLPCNRWKRSKIIDFRQRRFGMDKVWMRPPFGQGELKEVEATPAVLVPMMNAGWSQCAPPEPEVKQDVHD